MVHLETPDPPCQPGVGEGRRGRDSKQILVLRPERRERPVDPVERIAQWRQQPPSGLGQLNPPLGPLEQLDPDPLLEAAYLVADRRLGHPELVGGGGEMLVPSRGFEDPDGGQWRQSAHAAFHKSVLWSLSILRLDFGASES
jgi:hypothetical protein